MWSLYLGHSNISDDVRYWQKNNTYKMWVTCVTPRPVLKGEVAQCSYTAPIPPFKYSINYFVPLCLILDSPSPSFLLPFFISFSFLYTFFWFRIPWLSLISRMCARGLGTRLCRGCYLQFEGDGLNVGLHEVEFLDVASGSYQVLGHDTLHLLYKQ